MVGAAYGRVERFSVLSAFFLEFVFLLEPGKWRITIIMDQFSVPWAGSVLGMAVFLQQFVLWQNG